MRAFVRVNPDDPQAPFTNINGGQGADFISYTVNAPVRIDGGDGLDTLTVIGTEFGDDFVVTDKGVFGAGLFITYAGIEKVVVDAPGGQRPLLHRLDQPENVVLRSSAASARTSSTSAAPTACRSRSWPTASRATAA